MRLRRQTTTRVVTRLVRQYTAITPDSPEFGLGALLYNKLPRSTSPLHPIINPTISPPDQADHHNAQRLVPLHDVTYTQPLHCISKDIAPSSAIDHRATDVIIIITLPCASEKPTKNNRQRIQQEDRHPTSLANFVLLIERQATLIAPEQHLQRTTIATTTPPNVHNIRPSPFVIRQVNFSNDVDAPNNNLQKLATIHPEDSSLSYSATLHHDLVESTTPSRPNSVPLLCATVQLMNPDDNSEKISTIAFIDSGSTHTYTHNSQQKSRNNWNSTTQHRNPLHSIPSVLHLQRHFDHVFTHSSYNSKTGQPIQFPLSPCLHSNWKNLAKRPTYLDKYNDIIQDQLQQGIIGELPTTLTPHTDASKSPYCAVAYLRTQSGQNNIVKLLMGRSLLQPLHNTVTIPRLELGAIALGGKLMQHLTRELRITITQQYLWSD
ncbi:unnamed protein product [Heligmosomoides polygyrus]|uniref:Peptidase A1 domain-containing protein n=1 Tax=Heligmosomoides polygyrus TaxID=6339 RepID=A0A183F7E3_HELPZ|nr:unnamed protein product [Heligmosomoides polygyrus]